MKKSKYAAFICSLICAFSMMSSCNSGMTSGTQDLIDSLSRVAEANQENYLALSDYLNVIATGIDSIAAQEDSLFISNTQQNESPALSREKIKQNMITFQLLIVRQRERIDSLETAMLKETANAKQLQSIITSLKKQLAAKEAQIVQLQKDLESKNKDIAQLKTEMTTLTEQNTAQKEILSAQDEMLNQGFLKIATKQELKNAGMLEGGFLKKKKVNYDNIDKSSFKVIDIRNINDIEVPSANLKVLTPMPASSYTITNGENSSRLRITDAGRFWSLTNILIIQTD